MQSKEQQPKQDARLTAKSGRAVVQAAISSVLSQFPNTEGSYCGSSGYIEKHIIGEWSTGTCSIGEGHVRETISVGTQA